MQSLKWANLSENSIACLFLTYVSAARLKDGTTRAVLTNIQCPLIDSSGKNPNKSKNKV